MKTRKKPPRSLADIADKLFPNSPIEVVHEDKEYHIYVEGQWNRKSETLPEVFGQINNILFQYGDDWWYPSTRINPTWAKWPAVSVASLAGFTGRQHE